MVAAFHSFDTLIFTIVLFRQDQHRAARPPQRQKNKDSSQYYGKSFRITEVWHWRFFPKWAAVSPVCCWSHLLDVGEKMFSLVAEETSTSNTSCWQAEDSWNLYLYSSMVIFFAFQQVHTRAVEFFYLGVLNIFQQCNVAHASCRALRIVWFCVW